MFCSTIYVTLYWLLSVTNRILFLQCFVHNKPVKRYNISFCIKYSTLFLDTDLICKSISMNNFKQLWPYKKLKLYQLLRIHHWSKNLLLFIPLLAAQQLRQPYLILNTLIAIFCFSLFASSGYICNDIIDQKFDKNHPRKKNRPITNNDISVKSALMIASFLLVLACILSKFISTPLFCLLLFYFSFTLIYSFIGKKLIFVDILMLAILYTLRIYAGGMAANIAISKWLLLFSLLFFSSLALLKRVSEFTFIDSNLKKNNGRKYKSKHLPLLYQIGITTSALSIFILLCYIYLPYKQILYQNSAWLFLGIASLSLWLTRIWLLTYRGKVNDDPVIFALADPISYITGIICLISIILAN